MEGYWSRLYEENLRKAVDSNAVSMRPKHQEKRRHPRFKLAPGVVQTEASTDREIVDISASGVAFYAQREFPVDTTVGLKLQNTLPISAKVVGCAMKEFDPPSREDLFHVRCEFLDSVQGLRFISIALMTSDNSQVQVK